MPLCQLATQENYFALTKKRVRAAPSSATKGAKIEAALSSYFIDFVSRRQMYKRALRPSVAALERINAAGDECAKMHTRRRAFGLI
jgi:hypothetical protein